MDSLDLKIVDGGFLLSTGGRVLIRHSRERPFLRAGRGSGAFGMYRGNFTISESVQRLVALCDFTIVSRAPGLALIDFTESSGFGVTARFEARGARLSVAFEPFGYPAESAPNRYRITLPAMRDERVYGCGEQFSYFNLRGKNFPLWTSEQGVGRNKNTEITRLADLDGGSGGDYFWTFYPQASFVSSEGYWCGLDTSAYSEFDFRDPDWHELYAWELPKSLTFGVADTMPELLSDLSAYYGRQRALPEWCHDGVILGIQGGTEICLSKLARATASGVKVAGIWAQDWQGINMTSFGQRLRWNWVWDQIRYPGLDKKVADLKRDGVRFLGYINPYVGEGMSLFQEASAGGFLAKNFAGEDYLVDFGEFNAGIVDFTNPAAFEWYKAVIKKNLIGFGLSGWMADFGEYLPTDAVLFDGTSAEIAHNAWPAIWARCNREAVDEAVAEGLAQEGEIVYFMGACAAGSQTSCPRRWAGDQNVDWSEDDGLPSVIPAALSLGMSGHGLHHSDIGGYTTLYGMKRTKELFMRWAELSAFTAMMRGHEGNRPKDNWQFDSDDETLEHLGRMSVLHSGLKPYFKYLEKENAEKGLPLMRPLFLHHETDQAAWNLKDQYLLGEDVLVAPVLVEGARSRRVHFPEGHWIDAWSGKPVRLSASGESLGEHPGQLTIPAPLGQPPVFVKEDSRWKDLILDTFSKAGRSRYSRP